MTVTPIGQSGYILKTENTEIIIDPYLSDIVNASHGRPRMLPVPIKPEDIAADAVICTHNHLDHLDLGAIPRMPEDQFFITTREGKQKLAELDRCNVMAVKTGDSFMVGEFKITAVYAKHTVEAFGLVVKAEEYTLYFSGDTLFDEKLFDIAQYKPDVTFICINGRLGNMNVREALLTAGKIGAKANVPSHYDMFAGNSADPNEFARYIVGGRILDFNTEYDVSSLI